jgi:predicted secreted hydrolase
LVDRAKSWFLGSALLALVVVAAAAIFMRQEHRVMADGSSLAFESILAEGSRGLAAADEPWSFRFPADHGGHPTFRSEIWYLTGNLKDQAGETLGFQLAFFRLRLRPSAVERASAWGANQLFRAHLALTDVSAGRFHAEERFSRVALGLSGMDDTPVRVWVEDWSLETVEAEGEARYRLRAGKGESSLELDLQAVKPPVLEDAADLLGARSRAGALHSYVISRLSATGSLRLSGADRKVWGEAWLDRAWGAPPIPRGQMTLNRFALQLEDGRDLLCLQLRRRDGSGTPIPSCLLIGTDGSTKSFRRREIRLEPLAHWRSKLDGTAYPVRWRLELPGEGLDLEIDPLLEGQELDLATRVWSGAVEISGRSREGRAAGWGHLDLGGHAGI